VKRNATRVNASQQNFQKSGEKFLRGQGRDGGDNNKTSIQTKIIQFFRGQGQVFINFQIIQFHYSFQKFCLNFF
jgi:hypothetical protein